MIRKNNKKALWIALGLATCVVFGSVAAAEDNQEAGKVDQKAAVTSGMTDSSAKQLQAETTNRSPKEVCSAMVDALKKEDYKLIQQFTYHPGSLAQGKSLQQAGKAMKNSPEYLKGIKDLSCEDEHVAGTRAVVEATSQGDKRLIPFVKTSGRWKFDVKTYQSFYPSDMKSNS